MVVVDLGGGLAGVRAQDPPGVLDEAPFERDRRGEEQGVQGRAVEALADVGAGGHDQQWRPAGLGLEPGEGGGAGLGAHAAAQDDRSCPCVAQSCGEPLEVGGPLGEHQAVPPAGQGLGDVGDDLGGACVVGDQVPVDRGHPAGSGRVGVAGVAEPGGVHAEDGRLVADARSADGEVELRLISRRLVPGCGLAEWVMVCRIGPTCRAIRSSSLSRR